MSCHWYWLGSRQNVLSPLSTSLWNQGTNISTFKCIIYVDIMLLYCFTFPTTRQWFNQVNNVIQHTSPSCKKSIIYSNLDDDDFIIAQSSNVIGAFNSYKLVYFQLEFNLTLLPEGCFLFINIKWLVLILSS